MWPINLAGMTDLSLPISSDPGSLPDRSQLHFISNGAGSSLTRKMDWPSIQPDLSRATRAVKGRTFAVANQAQHGCSALCLEWLYRNRHQATGGSAPNAATRAQDSWRSVAIVGQNVCASGRALDCSGVVVAEGLLQLLYSVRSERLLMLSARVLGDLKC
jgi:hypothetical protein